jgi:uncharacterized Zn finger protein
MSKAGAEWGVTPWGKSVMQRMASSGGRLTRGEALAKNGSVYDVSESGRKLSCKVKGKSSPFYHVSVEWEALSAAHAGVVRDVLQGNLLLLGQLLSGDLPHVLLSDLAKRGVSLLPQDPSHMSPRCSCPDASGGGGGGGYFGGTTLGGGDFCKHAAALCYQLVAEIDKNPLLVLKMRGVDLSSLLGARAASSPPGAIQASALARLCQGPPFSPPGSASEAAASAAASRARLPLRLPALRPGVSVPDVLADAPAFSPHVNARDALELLYGFAKGKGKKKLGVALAWEKALGEPYPGALGGASCDEVLQGALCGAAWSLSVPGAMGDQAARVTIASAARSRR